MVNIQIQDSCEGFSRDIYRQRCRCFRWTEKQWRSVPPGTILQHDGRVESPLKPEEAPPLTSLAPGKAPWVSAQHSANRLKNQTKRPSQTSPNTLLPYICG